MLLLKNTENLTGASISGDFWDLDETCSSIYHLLGEEGRYFEWQGARIRLLSIAYNLRHASRGERKVEFVANGLPKEVMKTHNFIAPNHNIYFATEILWPELIFAFLAMNDFIKLYLKYEHTTEIDTHLVNARKFQSIIAEGLQENMSKEAYSVILSALLSPGTTVEEYAIQYIDMLNLSYINMSKEQRLQSFAAIVQNIIVDNEEYHSIKQQVLAEANRTKMSIHELKVHVEYPENIEW